MAQTPDDPFGPLLDAVRMLEKGEYDDDQFHELMERTDQIGELARMLAAIGQQFSSRDRQLRLLRRVIPVGVSLSAEKNFDRILETVVVEAQALTNADGGTLYWLEDQKYLKFVIVRNSSLKIAMGGTSGNKISFDPVPLYNNDGTENYHNVVSSAAWKRERINIADAYQAEGFDFSGTKKFDADTGYRSKSFLTFPLEDVDGKVIGVLQLINAIDAQSDEVISFVEEDALEALESLATAALSGYIREAELHREIAKLRIEIDESRRASQVAEITDTNYFKDLKNKARKLREKDDENS